MNKNNELIKEISEIDQILTDRNCTGYFICVTFDDAAGLARYNSSDYLQLLGYISLIKLDMSDQMLRALDENRMNIECKQGIDKDNKLN